MNPVAITVLLIEDNRGDARLIGHMLSQAQAMQFELSWVEDLIDGIAHLRAQRVDIVLLDLGLPKCTGLESLKRLLAAVPSAPPVIVLSGMSDEVLTLQAVQVGAQDYLIKGNVDPSLLARSIRYALERSHAKQALRRANDELERRVAMRTAELAQTVAALEMEVAERKQAEERIRRMVHYDALTGLPNRVLLQDRLLQEINHAHRHDGMVGIVFIDLDYFKNINDSLGHYVGDRLLKLAAARTPWHASVAMSLSSVCRSCATRAMPHVSRRKHSIYWSNRSWWRGTSCMSVPASGSACIHKMAAMWKP
jgi:PleD family two-component response regulator